VIPTSSRTAQGYAGRRGPVSTLLTQNMVLPAVERQRRTLALWRHPNNVLGGGLIITASGPPTCRLSPAQMLKSLYGSNSTEMIVYVVIWEPKHGVGGGHQSAQDKAKAEALRWRLSQERPDDQIRIEAVADYSAAAVIEGMQRRRRSREARRR
jgi:hypothetical protein